MWHNPGVSDDSYLDSWQIALHDKAQSTRRLYGEILAGFAQSLPEGRSLLDVTRRDCQAYFAGLKAQGRAQATIRSRWIALRSFYAWLTDEEEIADNPMSGVKVERAEPPPPDMPDDADVAKLLKACSGKGIWERRDLAMIRVAAATGLRVGELCALQLADVDLNTRIIVIRKGKGDKARIARIDPETAAAVDRYKRARGRHRLGGLPDLWLNRFGPMGIKGAQAMLPRRCEQAGVPKMHWHQLRHRFAHRWLANGGQEGDLAKLGGWSDPTVMRRYGSALATERALAAYDELGGVL
jgi:integrase/recombinase XerD